MEESQRADWKVENDHVGEDALCFFLIASLAAWAILIAYLIFF